MLNQQSLLYQMCWISTVMSTPVSCLRTWALPDATKMESPVVLYCSEQIWWLFGVKKKAKSQPYLSFLSLSLSLSLNWATHTPLAWLDGSERPKRWVHTSKIPKLDLIVVAPGDDTSSRWVQAQSWDRLHTMIKANLMGYRKLLLKFLQGDMYCTKSIMHTVDRCTKHN